MNKKTIRNQFAEFAGAETLDRFMDALHNNPACRTRLLFWQEKLWGDFAAKHQIEELRHDELFKLFTYCHRHDEDLQEGVPEEVGSFHDRMRGEGTHFLREAYRRVAARYFPFAAYEEVRVDPDQPARPAHCARCCDALGDYRNKSHHATMTLADYDKYVCDLETGCVEIYDRLGEDSGVGRLEGLALYYLDRRVTRKDSDSALAEQVALLDETARALICAADLIVDEASLDTLRAFVEQHRARPDTIECDAGQNLKQLETLFDLEADGDEDRSILRDCQWLYIALNEFHRESS